MDDLTWRKAEIPKSKHGEKVESVDFYQCCLKVWPFFLASEKQNTHLHLMSSSVFPLRESSLQHLPLPVDDPGLFLGERGDQGPSNILSLF